MIFKRSKKKTHSVLINIVPIDRPNTGLFSFCKELSLAIESVKKEYNIKTKYLVGHKCKHLIDGLKYVSFSSLNKRLFAVERSADLFHASYQLTRYMPHFGAAVLTIHDLNFLYEDSDNPKKINKMLCRIQRRIDRSKYIVAISEFAKQDVERHFNLKGKPIDVVYNGCSFFVGDKINAPNYTPSSKFIFSVGTVLPKKNFHVLPTLLVDNDYELVIAGRLSSYADAIMAEAKLYGVENRVKIIGEISEAEKDWYYRNCMAFAFPSIAEGFGLPLIEAMSYGKPTFISTHTSLPEIGKDYSFYFNDNFDREKMRVEFNSGMEAFKTHDVEAQIKYAHSYSWERAARTYCEIYLKLLTHG